MFLQRNIDLLEFLMERSNLLESAAESWSIPGSRCTLYVMMNVNAHVGCPEYDNP